MNWLTRKVLTVGTVTMSIKQTVDEEGVTHLTIDNKAGSGLPGSTESRILNDQIRNADHPLFGKITGRTRWAELTDLPSPWLSSGWEDGTTKVVLMTTEHLDVNAVTYQAGALEIFKGERRYVRHVEVRKGEEVLQVKLVYDYLGPLEN